MRCLIKTKKDIDIIIFKFYYILKCDKGDENFSI